jgi:hypothetical protein
LHGGLTPESAAVTGPGETSFTLSGAWSNTYNQKAGRYTIDVESREVGLYLAHGIGSGVELSLTMPVVWQGGGFTDSGIKNWDSAIGFPNRRRNRAVDDQFEISGRNADRSRFDLGEDGLNSSRAALGAKYMFVSEPNFQSSALLQTFIPTGDMTAGVDLLLGTLAGYQHDKWSFETGVAGIVAGDNEYLNLKYEPFRVEGFVLTRYALNASWSAFCGFLGGSSTIKDVPLFDGDQLYVDIGIGAKITDTAKLSFALRENVGKSNSTTDISGILLLSWNLNDHE